MLNITLEVYLDTDEGKLYCSCCHILNCKHIRKVKRSKAIRLIIKGIKKLREAKGICK
jgi:hypothetical protein